MRKVTTKQSTNTIKKKLGSESSTGFSGGSGAAPPFYRIKILSMGDKQTGKSCLIKRYCEGKFEPNYIGTIGIDYGVKKVYVDQTELRVNFWDLSGDEHYLDVRNEFYKDSQGVILVYDVNLRETFDRLQKWLEEGKKYQLPNHIPIIVVGNKSDVNQRQVSYKEGENFALEKGYSFYETSSLTGDYVNEMFEHLFSEVLKKNR